MPITAILIDDEPLARQIIREFLLAFPQIEILAECENGKQAVAAINHHKPDLIFLDVQMPGMDGFELCTKIRALPTNKTTPVIFVTSLTDFKSRARSSLSGGNDLIAKPFMFIELAVKALTHVIRGRVVQQKLAA
ncbi:response regulator [candidate division KSB1 bacterium]|nr:response regulator [candidate division KSB1 bacterium]